MPGVPPANVAIIGGGVVGTNAAKIALGFGAKVTLVDVNLNRLRELDDIFGGRLYTLASNSYNVAQATREADLVIGGVLIPGATAPKLVTRAMVAQMKKGAVIVDVAIDQGGCVETARPTSHSNPSYMVDGVVHYCVTNMPGAVPHTSTLALTNSTFPYLLRIANLGAREALRQDAGSGRGIEYLAGHAHLSRRGREPAAAVDGGVESVIALKTGTEWQRAAPTWRDAVEWSLPFGGHHGTPSISSCIPCHFRCCSCWKRRGPSPARPVRASFTRCAATA